MLSAKKAIKLTLDDFRPLRAEKLQIEAALARVTSEDVTSKKTIPKFDNASMDGFAVRHADIKSAGNNNKVSLNIIGESRCGVPFEGALKKNTAIRIMTGAILPNSADTVIKQEDVTLSADSVLISASVKKNNYVRFAGEDIKKGQTVLKKGSTISPADIGVLASIRHREVKVYKRPTVAILSTGDEITTLDDKSPGDNIIASNMYSLAAQIRDSGCKPVLLGIVKDDKKALKKKLSDALKKKYDILITTGGISVGDYDFVREILLELGCKNLVHKVAMRPGKPFSFFTNSVTKIFALPGNPVSCLVSFELFVRPAIKKMQGLTTIFPRKLDAILMNNLKKIKGYNYFIRAIIKKTKSGYTAKPTGTQSSGVLMSMSRANGLIVAESKRETIEKGETVNVIVLDASFDDTKTF
ncbi:gephyrin-like molybdotransferase Glp [Thermodesulfobacteriota bacterium]